MRFVQLLKLCDFKLAFSLNDIGCGYGALIAYLDRRHPNCVSDYVGIDVSAMIIRLARRLRGLTAAELPSPTDMRPLGQPITQSPAGSLMSSRINHARRGESTSPLVLIKNISPEQPVRICRQLHETADRNIGPQGTLLHRYGAKWARYCTTKFGCSGGSTRRIWIKRIHLAGSDPGNEPISGAN